MSTKVVPAPAHQATQPVRAEKLAKQTDEQNAVQEEEARLADGDSEEEVTVDQADEEIEVSESSLADDFTFGHALAEAAASSGSLITEAEEVDEAGFGELGDGSGGTVLLIGAVALVGLGIAVLADGGGSSNAAPTADATVAVATDEDTPAAVTVVGSDPDGDTLTYTAGAASNGTVAGGSGGVFTYTPNANFFGEDTFTVTTSDPDGLTATTTVTVTVAPVADAPTGAATQAVVTDEDTALTGAVTITDPDGDDVTYAITSAAASGTVVLAADGTFTYTPDQDFFGEDTFTVSGTSADGSASQAVTVTVNPINDAPVQNAGTTTALTVAQDSSGVFLIDFTDADGDTLTASSTTPANGTIDPTTNTYTPNAGFTGSDTFDVTVSDGTESVTYTVAVSVVEDLSTTTSIDVSGDTPVAIDAAGGAFIFTDDVTARTDVILTNFSSDDVITVTDLPDGAQYFFTNPNSDDLVVTFNDGVNFTRIYIDDILPDNPGFITDLQSAIDEVGFNFINFA